MKDYLSLLSDVLILILDFSLYISIIPLKKDTKFNRIFLIIGCAIMFTVYVIGVSFFHIPMAFWTACSVSIPSFILLFSFSKYKDARFIMTFCFIDTIALMIGFISRYIEMLIYGFEANTFIPVTITLVLCLSLIFLGRKFLRNFKELIDKVKSNWNELAVASVFIYILLIVSMAFPKPLKERLEYGPFCLFLCLTIIVFYSVFISSIIKTKKIEEANEELAEKNKLYELAYTDALCNIGNRNSFDLNFNIITKHKQMYRNICLIVMDVNNTKLINDTYGHYAGDKSLICVADCLKNIFSGKDFKTFRVGGDEFCVMCFNKEKVQIENSIKNFNKQIKDTKPYKELSVAAGFEFWKYEEEELSDTFHKADKNMYSVKKSFKSAN